MFSYTQAAAELGVSRRVMPELVRICGFEERRHPTNGLAKAITPAEMTAIRRFLDKQPGRKGKARAT
jgi:hypothetical protein